MLETQNAFKIHNPEIYLQVEAGINADKIQQLEETVEILKEQIESLKLELWYRNYELEEIKQELNYANHELCAVNEFYATSSKLVSSNEVKKLAKNLLVEKSNKAVL